MAKDSVRVEQRAYAVCARLIWSRRLHAELLGLLGVLAIVLLFGFRLFGPSTSVPGDVLAAIPPWDIIFQQPYNPLISDVVVQVYPNRQFISDTLQNGEFPLWNPFILSGHPLVADPYVALFYPTTLALAWLTPANALDIQILLHLLVIALGMYVLVRLWGGGKLGALVAAAVFCGSSALTVWQQYNNNFNIAGWLPWLLVCFELAKGKRRFLWVGAGGFVLGLIFLANFLQWALYIVFFVGCYAAWLSFLSFRQHGLRQAVRPLVNFVAIGVLGIGIGAVQLLPLFELTQLSGRNVTSSYEFLRGGVLPLPKLLTGLAPNFFGTPVVHNSTWGPSINYAEGTMYWGFYPLLLALTAPLWRRERNVWFVWTVMLLVGSMVLGTPILHLLVFVPGFNVFATARMIYLLCFCGAVLCGLVLERVWILQHRWRTLIVIGGLAVSARMLLHLALVRAVPNLPSVTTPMQHDLQWVTLLVIAGLLIFALPLMLRHNAVIRGAQAALALVIIADIVHFSLPYNAATFSEDHLYPRPNVFAALPQDHVLPRVAVIRQQNFLMLPNTLMPFRLTDIGGYTSLLRKEYKAFVTQLDFNGRDSALVPYQNMVTASNVDAPIVNLAGAQYVVSAGPLVATEALGLLASGQSLYLYRNHNAAPRVFIVDDVQVVPNSDVAAQTLGAPTFNVCQFATLETPPFIPPLARTSAGCVGSAAITRYIANEVVVHVDTPVDGMLVLSDAYYPGWQVTVDNTPQPLFKANGVFRGAWVGKGVHEVRFSFQPRRVLVGGVVSVASLIAVLTCIVVAVRRHAS